MSNIWALHVPAQAGFAEASSLYESAMAGNRLPCGHHIDSPPKYQLLEWEPGKEPLGDFVAAGAWIVGHQQFLSRMSRLVHGYELGEVRYIEPVKKKGMRSPGGGAALLDSNYRMKGLRLRSSHRTALSISCPTVLLRSNRLAPSVVALRIVHFVGSRSSHREDGPLGHQTWAFS